MALRKDRNTSAAIKKRRSGRQITGNVVGGLFRAAGSVLNAPGYNWIGNQLDKLISGKEKEKEPEKDKKDEKTGQLTKEVSDLTNTVSQTNKIQRNMMDIISGLQKDVSFIKDRVSVTFFEVKDMQGEMKSVMYDPLGPAGGQFRRATEGGTLTAELPKELEKKVIAKVASYTLKQYQKEQDKKLEQIESKLEKITPNVDPTQFKDPTEDTGADPLERLRREMNEGFEKIMEMLKDMQSATKGGLFDFLPDLKDMMKILTAAAPFLKVLGRLGLVGLAGYLGYELGKYINEKFSVSDKILNGIEWIKDKLSWMGFETEEQKVTEGDVASESALTAAMNARLKALGYERVGSGKYKDKEGNILRTDQLPAEMRSQLTEGLRDVELYKTLMRKEPQEYGLTDETISDPTKVNERLAEILTGTGTEQKRDLLQKAAEARSRERAMLRNDPTFKTQLREKAKEVYGSDLTDAEVDKLYTEYRIDSLKNEETKGIIEPTGREAVVDSFGEFLTEKTQEGKLEQRPDGEKPLTEQESLREAIGKRESQGNYDAVNTTGELKGKKANKSDFEPEEVLDKSLTDMTLQEVNDYQNDYRIDNETSRAVGKYQFMRTTLFGKNGKGGGLVDDYNRAQTSESDKIKMTDKFTPDVQDRLFDFSMTKRETTLRNAGVDINPATLYSSHYIGEGATAKVNEAVKKGQGDKTVAQVMKDANMTVGENPELYRIKAKDWFSTMQSRVGSDTGTTRTDSSDMVRPKETGGLAEQQIMNMAESPEERELLRQGLYGIDSDEVSGDGKVEPTEERLPANQTQPTASNSTNNQTNLTVPVINNNNILAGNMGGGSDSGGIGSTRPDDSSFGRARMRDGNLPWELGSPA